VYIHTHTHTQTTAAKYKRSVSQIGHSWLELRACTTTKTLSLSALFSGPVSVVYSHRVPDNITTHTRHKNFCPIFLFRLSLVLFFRVSVSFVFCAFSQSTVIFFPFTRRHFLVSVQQQKTSDISIVFYNIFISPQNPKVFPTEFDRRPAD
jgi:hypothetical protein